MSAYMIQITIKLSHTKVSIQKEKGINDTN